MIKSQDFTLQELQTIPVQGHQLVFVFGYRNELEENLDYEFLRNKFPQAEIVITSTAGHIKNNQFDEGVVVSAHQFEHTEVKAIALNATQNEGNLIQQLTNSLPHENLKALLVTADNTFGNSSDLIRGLNDHYKGTISIFGGLGGNLDLNVPSISGLNKTPGENNVILLGLYGDQLRVHTKKIITAKGFGLDYKVTAYNRNELIELNGKSAYDLLFKLLNAKSIEHFNEQIMLYAFLVKSNGRTKYVRSPILINHEKKTILYGGDFQIDDKVQLTRSDVMKALEETEKHAQTLSHENPQLVFLTSCYGRRLFLNELIEDELKALNEGMGKNIPLTGFYSYAEFLSERRTNNACVIHNNSIALVALSE